MIAEMVGHHVEHGFDVWWRANSHHMPLAGDLHSIMVQGWYDITPVTELNVDSFLQRVD